MGKQQIRKWYIFLICILFVFSGCAGKDAEFSTGNPGVRVTYFDVGKGDAILIETQGHTVLIDAGYDDTFPVIEGYLKKQGIQKLDYLAITHFDKDHVGGADRIVNNFDIGQVLQPDYESDAGQYLEYCSAMEEKGVQPVSVTEPLQFGLDGAEFYIYPPQKEQYKEDNDFSLVISMVYREKSFLFAGDCEKERLDELLAQTDFGLSHDVLKVPHHGKKEDNSGEFLAAVSPEAAVITCSEEKPASDKICDMLTGLGAEIYLTADGTVTCLCDGESLQVFISAE